MNCAICNGRAEKHGESLVLGKHTAEYQLCTACGFLQVVNPHWLEEAYESAMTSTDIGHVWRADYLSKITKAVIHAFNNPKGRFVDFGAGYGISVRKMRDLGYDFSWHDKYSENLFAKGFEAELQGSSKYELATAFEVFEHLSDPMRQISEVIDYSDEVFFTTELISRQPPPLDEWWYYAPEHGQHIAFYTEDALRSVAAKFSLNFVTNGVNLHLFTRKKIAPRVFKLVVRDKVCEWFNFLNRRPSLLSQDFDDGRKRVLAAQQEPHQAEIRRSK